MYRWDDVEANETGDNIRMIMNILLNYWSFNFSFFDALVNPGLSFVGEAIIYTLFSFGWLIRMKRQIRKSKFFKFVFILLHNSLLEFLEI